MEDTLQISLEEKFDWKNYEKKIPIVRLIIVGIELLLFLIFLIIRFDYVYSVMGGEFNYNGGTVMIFYNYGENGEIIPFIVDQFTEPNQTKLSIHYSMLPYLGNFGVSLTILVAHYIEFANALKIAGISEAFVLFLIIGFIIFFTFAIGGAFAPLIRKKKALKKALEEREKFIAEYGGDLIINGKLINKIEFPQRIVKTPSIEENGPCDEYGVILKSRDIHYAPIDSVEEKMVYNTPIIVNYLDDNIERKYSYDIKYAPIGSDNEKENKTNEIKEIIEEKTIDVQSEHFESGISNDFYINDKEIELDNDILKEEYIEEDNELFIPDSVNDTKVIKKPVKPISAIDDNGKGKEYIIETSSPNNLSEEENDVKESEKKNRPSALVKNRRKSKKTISKK